MKELKISKLDFIESFPIGWKTEDWIKMKLFEAGFDLNKEYAQGYEAVKDEYIFTQGD